MLDDRRHVVEDHLHLTAEHIGNRQCRAAIRHMLHLHAGHHHEHLTRQMHRGAVAGRRHVHLAGIGFHISDKFGDSLGRHILRHRHHVGGAVESRDRRDILNEVERQLRIERGVDVIGRVHQQDRVAIRLSLGDRVRADVVARARLVLNDELLACALRQPLSNQPRQNVGRATCRIADDELHGTGRIIERRGTFRGHNKR